MEKSETIKLREFWNSVLGSEKPQAINEKFITEDEFNSAVKKYLPENGRIIDYGCGDGWALCEIDNTIKVKSGLGLDPSENGVRYANECCKLSLKENLSFMAGDEKTLKTMPEEFDGAVSFNVIDCIPDETRPPVLEAIRDSLKPGCCFLMGINPDLSNETLKELGYELKGNCHYKNGIFRGVHKSVEEWEKILSKYFELVEFRLFYVVESEKKYPPRRMFILRKR